MPVTQKDIARAVGVSQTVVSDVLQDRPRARVGVETRKRILETARAMGYRPNASARSLRTQRSHQIAYLIARDRVQGGYALGEQALGALAATLAEHDHQLTLRVVGERGDAPALIADLFAGGQCDACVVRVAQTAGWDWEALTALPHPLLFLGHCEDSVRSLAFDAAGCVRTVCEHLAARGHHRAVLLAGDEPVDFYAQIRDAWTDAAAAAGLAADILPVAERYDASAATRRALHDGGATAFVCQKGAAGIGAADAVAASGKRPGGDVDVVVFGDPVFGEETPAWLYPPGVWFFDTNQSAVGRRAADEALRLARGDHQRGPIRLLPALKQVPTDALPL